MATIRSGFNTGGDSGGKQSPQNRASGLAAAANAASGVGAAAGWLLNKAGVSTGPTATVASGGAAKTNTASGGGGGAVSSSTWYCPNGATLTRESTGSGNLVCRWNHNGAEFQAMRRTGGGPSGGGGSAGGGGGSPVIEGGDSRWIQSAADTFAANPEAMLAHLLHEQYGDTAGNTLYNQLKPYADAANALFLADRGNATDGGSKDDFLGYLENYWDALQTPGARLNFQQSMSNILNPTADTPLHSYLTGGTPEQNTANALRLMAGVANTSYHPLIAQAMMNDLGMRADRHIGASGTGATDPFYSTLTGYKFPGR